MQLIIILLEFYGRRKLFKIFQRPDLLTVSNSMERLCPINKDDIQPSNDCAIDDLANVSDNVISYPNSNFDRGWLL